MGFGIIVSQNAKKWHQNCIFLLSEKNNTMNKIYENSKVINCSLGENIIVGENSFLQNSNFSDNVQINRSNMIVNSTIGAYTYTGMNTVIKHADIGKFCSISWGVSISGGGHNYNCITPHPFVHLPSFGIVATKTDLEIKRISIGNDVWIGMNSCILQGTTIGDGAVIGAGSVVTKNVPPYAVVVGNPAKILKYRFSDKVISKLLDFRWWDLPKEFIVENIEYFQNELTEDRLDSLIELINNP